MTDNEGLNTHDSGLARPFLRVLASPESSVLSRSFSVIRQVIAITGEPARWCRVGPAIPSAIDVRRSRSSDRRPPQAMPRRLLERVRELEHAPVIAMASHDLEPDR
jgi:hypothetical protein